MLIGNVCARCGDEFLLGDDVIQVMRVTHRGRVHTEVDPKFIMGSPAFAHLDCPRHARARGERL
jgi:hypothetical protein